MPYLPIDINWLQTQYSIFTDMTKNFESTMFASVYGTEPAYEATAPDIQARHHVRAPSILGNMQINFAKGKAGRASSADMPSTIDGGNPAYTANMPSTSRWGASRMVYPALV